jgi:probable phosphoglycerate mutase
MEAMLVEGPGELILVRHGQQGPNEFNDPMRPYGGNMELSELGYRQADVVADALADEEIHAVYASPLYRASATGTAIARRHGLEPVILEDLQEFHGYRDLPPGKTVLDVLGEDGIAEMRRRFISEQRFDSIVYSESGDEFRGRVMTAIEHIKAQHPENSRVVVACHSGVINIVLSRVLGMGSDLVSFVAHASISRVMVGNGRMAVRSVNQDQHLRAAGVLTY